MVTTLVDTAPIPGLPCTGVGNVGASQVHTQHIRWRLRGGHRGFDLDMNRVGAIAMLTQLRTGGPLSMELAALVVAEMEPETYPAMEQG